MNRWTTTLRLVAASVLLLSLLLLFLSGGKPDSSAFLLRQEIEPAEQSTLERLRTTVRHLSETIGERNLSKPKKLNETIEYVQKSFESIGYKIERQSFKVSGVDCHNLIVEVVGNENPKEIILVGAHYDSARNTPGANDNGSGLAALLEIAGQMRDKQFSRTIRFVAFANEEPPYFQRDGQMGSWVYARAAVNEAMISN